MIQRRMANEAKAMEESKTKLKQEVADFSLFSTYYLKEVDLTSTDFNRSGIS